LIDDFTNPPFKIFPQSLRKRIPPQRRYLASPNLQNCAILGLKAALMPSLAGAIA